MSEADDYRAALKRDTENTARLGVLGPQGDVIQRALSDSGKTSPSALTELEKAQATLSLITEMLPPLD